MDQFEWHLTPRSVVNLAGPEVHGWYHLSQGNQWILRSFINGVQREDHHLPQLADLQGHVEEQLTLSEVNELTGLPATTTPCHNQQWSAILTRLQEVRQNEVGVPGNVIVREGVPDILLRKTIPVTKMRRFYEFLGLMTSLKSHLAIAKELQRAPARFAECFRESIDHFARYENDEAFIPNNCSRRDLPCHNEVTDIRDTRHLTTFLSHNNGPWIVANDPTLNFRYLDREIVLARTTGCVPYEDGRVAASGTRLDWLLKNEQDSTPVLGEVKVGNDKSPFYALVQLLMHATELATKAQLRRVHRHWPETFYTRDPEAPEDPEQEIAQDHDLSLYIILAGYNRNSPIREELLDTTGQLSRVLADEYAIGSRIRRFACLEATLDEGRNLHFSKVFSYPEWRSGVL